MFAVEFDKGMPILSKFIGQKFARLPRCNLHFVVFVAFLLEHSACTGFVDICWAPPRDCPAGCFQCISSLVDGFLTFSEDVLAKLMQGMW